MSKFRLLSISQFEKCTEVYSGYEFDVLASAGEVLLKKNPGKQLVIVDEQGYLVWPETLKSTAEREQEMLDFILPKSKGAALPPSCQECSMESCRLPYSKVLPNRKLSDFTYKRHPKCQLEADSCKGSSKKQQHNPK